MRESIVRAFERRNLITDTDECILWTGQIVKGGTGAGYGRIFYRSDEGNNKVMSAHRVSYYIYNGPLDPELVIRHTCGNKSCVNPRHLVQGTQAENNRDRARLREDKRYLSQEQVAEIRKLTAEGRMTHVQIAAQFGVTVPSIDRIYTGRTHAGVA